MKPSELLEGQGAEVVGVIEKNEGLRSFPP